MRGMLTLALSATLALTGCANMAKDDRGTTLPTINDYQLYSGGDKPTAQSLATVIDACSNADVVVLGEFHGVYSSHQLQLDAIQALHRLHGAKLVLSMEHLDRDVQSSVDAYLAGEIGERPFLSATRLGSVYSNGYRPIFSYAKDHGIHIIASRVPAKLRRRISAEGKEVINQFTAEEKKLAPRFVFNPPGKYRDNFFRAMGVSDFDAASPDLQQRLLNAFRAQCSWDDSMAEAVTDHLRKDPNARVVHLCGAFHSNEGMGTVERILLRRPGAKVVVLSPFFVEGVEGASKAEVEAASKLGDFVYAVRTMPQDFVDAERRKKFMEERMKAHRAPARKAE